MNTYRSLQKPIFARIRPDERRTLLLIGDLTATILALLCALYFWAARDDWLNFSWEFLKQRPQVWFYFLPVIWIILLIELYDIRRASRRNETLLGILIAAGVATAIYLLVFFFSPQKTLPRFSVGAFIVAAFILTLVWRMTYIRIFTAPLFMRRVLVVGAGRAGKALGNILKELWPPPFFVVGYIDDDPEKIGDDCSQFPVLGGSDRIDQIIHEQNITDLIFAISGEMKPDMFQALIKAEEDGVQITTLPVIYEEILGRVPIFLLQSDWILRSFVDQIHTGQFYEFSKRLMDIIGGAIGSIILGALTPLLTLLILIDDGFPIIYSQNRVGKSGEIYPMIKFRTMKKDAEKDGKARLAVQNDERVTRIGRWLRKSHLDELPQFLLVLRGDMSLVGPRAERPELVDNMQEKVPFYRARLLVKPGLTGWAQINQPYAATIAEMGVKLEYDLYYIKHRNILLDFTILLRTVGSVVGFRGQ
jgi:exopolysaccharide biosynthesis polyprenyl glycosylphosphotransferase